MALHVAILQSRYVDLILAGRKRVESRLTRTRQPPFEAVRPGERVYLKISAGPFRARAVVAAVACYDRLTPDRVETLRRRYNDRVLGDDAFWHAKRDCRFATFIELADVEPIDVGPAYTKSLRAWHVVDESLDPVLDVPLTAGAIRNRYVVLPPAFNARPANAHHDADSADTFELRLPDGRLVHSRLVAGRRIQWRGWGAYYDRHGTRPGDTVRLIRSAPGRYDVRFIGHARR